jgi:hypothetical protein
MVASENAGILVLRNSNFIILFERQRIDAFKLKPVGVENQPVQVPGFEQSAFLR